MRIKTLAQINAERIKREQDDAKRLAEIGQIKHEAAVNRYNRDTEVTRALLDKQGKITGIGGGESNGNMPR